MTQQNRIEAANPVGIVTIDTYDAAGRQPRASHCIAAPDLDEQVAALAVPLSQPRPQGTRASFIPEWRLGQERLEAVFHRSHPSRALWMQADLQAGNLVQIKTEYSQPVREAKSGVLAQRYDLTNMGRDAVSQLIEETGGNEIRRSASVAPTSGSRKLG